MSKFLERGEQSRTHNDSTPSFVAIETSNPDFRRTSLGRTMKRILQSSSGEDSTLWPWRRESIPVSDTFVAQRWQQPRVEGSSSTREALGS